MDSLLRAFGFCRIVFISTSNVLTAANSYARGRSGFVLLSDKPPLCRRNKCAMLRGIEGFTSLTTDDVPAFAGVAIHDALVLQ